MGFAENAFSSEPWATISVSLADPRTYIYDKGLLSGGWPRKNDKYSQDADE